MSSTQYTLHCFALRRQKFENLPIKLSFETYLGYLEYFCLSKSGVSSSFQ